MKSSKLFITGCDQNHRWMLDWFVENFKKHNPTAELLIYDFDTEFMSVEGWFKKPSAMIEATSRANQVCWIDTDCEVKGNLDGIWNHVQENKLTMAVDQPWTTRRPNRGTWFNSGVVAFTGYPQILQYWNHVIMTGSKEVGDQEVLNSILGNDPLRELTYIEHLPRIYNTLRLDLIDNTAPANPKIMHWTGQKGKVKIREMMND